MVIYLEQGAGLHMAQLMPLLLIVSCFSKIQIGFTFLVHKWYRLTWVVLDKGPLNGCVCLQCLDTVGNVAIWWVLVSEFVDWESRSGTKSVVVSIYRPRYTPLDGCVCCRHAPALSRLPTKATISVTDQYLGVGRGIHTESNRNVITV